MKSIKNIRIIVNKEQDYKPIRKKEIERISNYLIAEVIELAGRFDGPSKLIINIEIIGKGNA